MTIRQRRGGRAGDLPDPRDKLRRFPDNQELNFELLSDEDHAVADAYGVWVEKSMYGKTYFGNERTTFVLDPKGGSRRCCARSSPPSTTSWCWRRLRHDVNLGLIQPVFPLMFF